MVPEQIKLDLRVPNSQIRQLLTIIIALLVLRSVFKVGICIVPSKGVVLKVHNNFYENGYYNKKHPYQNTSVNRIQ